MSGREPVGPRLWGYRRSASNAVTLGAFRQRRDALAEDNVRKSEARLRVLARMRRPRRGILRRVGWPLAALLALSLAGAVWLLRTRVPESFVAGPEAGGAGIETVRAFRLYFGDPNSPGFIVERRWLPAERGLEESIRSLVESLLKGPRSHCVSPWPEDVQLRRVFVDSSGVAYLDFDGSLRWRLPEGDYSEWLLAGSLTLTLCENLPAVTGVRLMIDGESEGLLRGLVRLDRVLRSRGFLLSRLPGPRRLAAAEADSVSGNRSGSAFSDDGGEQWR